MLKYSIEASLGRRFYINQSMKWCCRTIHSFLGYIVDIYGLKNMPLYDVCGFFSIFKMIVSGYVSIQKPCKLIVNHHSLLKINLIAEAREIRKNHNGICGWNDKRDHKDNDSHFMITSNQFWFLLFR